MMRPETQKKQIFPLSCGAASLLVAAYEMGIEIIPKILRQQIKGSDLGLGPTDVLTWDPEESIQDLMQTGKYIPSYYQKDDALNYPGLQPYEKGALELHSLNFPLTRGQGYSNVDLGEQIFNEYVGNCPLELTDRCEYALYCLTSNSLDSEMQKIIRTTVKAHDQQYNSLTKQRLALSRPDPHLEQRIKNLENLFMAHPEFRANVFPVSLPHNICKTAGLLGLHAQIEIAPWVLYFLKKEYPKEESACAQLKIPIHQTPYFRDLAPNQRALHLVEAKTADIISLKVHHYILERPTSCKHRYMEPARGENLDKLSNSVVSGKNCKLSLLGLRIVLSQRL